MEEITKKIKEGLREFSLTTLAVDNRTSIFLLTLMIILFGVQSYDGMPKEAYPEIPWPKVYVNTLYFGNSGEDIENLVTRPLEKEIATISEIKTISSSSLQDFSLIVAEFNSDVDLDEGVRKIKDAVDRAKPDLPDDLTKEPEVLDINMSEIPIMTVNLAGNFTNDELNNFAEYLRDEIKDLKEISDVGIKGIMEKEIAIEVDLPKMEARQISFTDIENAIRSENVTMSGGEILNGDFRRNIRTIGEFKSAAEIENMIVKSENGHPVFMKDIAKVTYDFQEPTSIARADGQPVVSLDVIKKSGQNLLSASDKIKEIVEKAKAEVFPDDLRVTIFNDLSIRTRQLVSDLQNSIISGMLLVVLVLLFFLGLRNSLFVGIAIPTSMLMGILIIHVIGYSLNMVVLFSLILALGMLVDNAIVVVENIYRYMQNGYSGIEAAKYATGEVAVPIIASTATTLAAFVPLAFWPGLMGEFMRYMPITLIIVLSSSLFVALVINPVLTSAFMKVDTRAKDPEVRKRKRRNALIFIALGIVISVIAHFAKVYWLRHMMWILAGVTAVNYFILRKASIYFQNRILPFLELAYDRFIRFALRKYNPFLFFGGTVALLIFSLVLLAKKQPNVVLFSEHAPEFVNVFVELPMGKDIQATNKTMRQIEARVNEIIEPYRDVVEAVLSQIGENTSDPNAGPDFSKSPTKGRLTVSFVPSLERIGVDTYEILEAIRSGLHGQFPGVKIVVDKPSNGPPIEKPINIEIRGEDINTLAHIADDLTNFIESQNIEGIEELKQDVKIGKPELTIHIDRNAARRYGLSTYAIADAIRTSVFGKEVSKFKEGDDEHPINVRLNEKYRYDIGDLLNQRITFRNPANGRISQVPVSAVADISYSSTYNAINRKDQERTITVFSNILTGYNPNVVVSEVRDALKSFKMPAGYTFEFTGQQQQQNEEAAFLITALGLAVFGILIIIVAQFNSILSPLIILMSVLFSTIGVFLGYVFTGMDIVIVMTGVGVISLAGIVVNNAIVLIDYTNLLIQRKRTALGLRHMNDLTREAVREAIVEGGSTRLRPVLLTAITTVLGLIPLAIGFNFDFFGLIRAWDPNMYIGGDNVAFWGTMAWTVIYGLTFSTFLTLVVVPVMYWLVYRAKRRLMIGASDT
ncbi:MAG: efflux RND transporter permease subunit [Bacteroidetes bacterium]|nr:MAG: efflux RND transporter permease subunit [Bacteroidota bacterium]